MERVWRRRRRNGCRAGRVHHDQHQAWDQPACRVRGIQRQDRGRGRAVDIGDRDQRVTQAHQMRESHAVAHRRPRPSRRRARLGILGVRAVLIGVLVAWNRELRARPEHVRRRHVWVRGQQRRLSRLEALREPGQRIARLDHIVAGPQRTGQRQRGRQNHRAKRDQTQRSEHSRECPSPTCRPPVLQDPRSGATVRRGPADRQTRPALVRSFACLPDRRPPPLRHRPPIIRCLRAAKPGSRLQCAG